MMGLFKALFNFVTGILKSLVFPAIIFAGGFFVWKQFKKDRDRKIFTVSFHNIDGLSKGAPVFAHGTKVGKVIKTSPLLNSNKVGVKILITDDNFPKPGQGTHVELVNSIETGGGKIIELSNIEYDEKVGKNYFVEHYGKDFYKVTEPISSKNMTKVLFDLYKLTEDFAKNMITMLTSDKAMSYKDQVENSLKNTITSIEYGTLENDVKYKIKEINEEIKKVESDPVLRAHKKMEMRNQIQALKHTIGTMVTVSGNYKEDYIGGIENNHGKKKKFIHKGF